MKNLNFVDPEVVSKEEILSHLKGKGVSVITQMKRVLEMEKRLLKFNDFVANGEKPSTDYNSNAHYSRTLLDSADIEWLDSITNEAALTPDEATKIFALFESTERIKPRTNCYGYYKPALLFDRRFFPDAQDASTSFLNRFFRTDLLNDERIKSIPLLFKKIDDKETFDPFVGEIIKEIRAYCAQNKEFADAYQTKLAEIRNNNGSLQERLVLSVDAYTENVEGCEDLIFELEQPTFEMFRESLNGATIYGTPSLQNHGQIIPLLVLSFISLLQTFDGMQIPRWNEENYLCRLLLDYEIVYHFGILDKLFRDYTTTDVFLIICNHLKWRNANMPQNQTDHRREYAQFLEAQLPELFSGVIPHKYLDLLYKHFFSDNKHLHLMSVLNAMSNPYLKLYRVGGRLLDLVQFSAYDFLEHYLIEKIAPAISENNHEQIRDISRLFDNKNMDWIENIFWKMPNPNSSLKLLQSRISYAMKFFESGDHTEKLRDILRDSKNHDYFLESLLSSLMKNQKDKNPSLSLEDFVQKYIPLEIFPKILPFDFFQEQNEDVYQSMIQQYPGLSREDALLDRLSPCFAAIAIKNTDEMLSMLDLVNPYPSYTPIYDPAWQLFLYVLDQLCERYEKEHELIALIFEIIFRNEFYVPTMLDIIKKYPQVQQLVVEHCYTILKGAWDTLICTPFSSHPIGANIPVRIIGLHKGAWHGLKPLLIALRKTRMEWVDASLTINSECHPNGNSNLVGEIQSYFDFFRESLKNLRQDMANGLSDWLKPLPESKRGDLKKRLTEFPEIEQDWEGFDITYTEPDPVWRYAYVRAIADLGVDVDGKGHYIHSIMDKVAKEDPSEMVRKAAEKASAKLKNLRDGWDGDDHYKKINLAFWWIKQASRLALDLPIDGKRSLETRNHKDEWEDRCEQFIKTQSEAGKLLRARLKI